MDQHTSGDLLKDRTLGTLRRMLDYRRQYDSRRSLFYRQYVGQRDAQKFPDNKTARANTFVPYPLSNVETVVSRTSDAFFSYSPFFECDASTPGDDQAANAMQMVLEKKLHEANLPDNCEQLFRNLGIYGFGALKVDWNWDFKTITKPVAQYHMDPSTGQPLTDPNTGQPAVSGFRPQSFSVPMACPKITPIDIYDLLIDPNGFIVAQLTEKPLGTMVREADVYKQTTGLDLWDPTALNKLVQAVTQAYSGKGDPNSVLIRYAEVWNRIDNSMTTITFGEDSEAIAWKRHSRTVPQHEREFLQAAGMDRFWRCVVERRQSIRSQTYPHRLHKLY